MADKELPPSQQEIFQFIGGYGPWQRKVFLFFFAVNIIGIWQNFAITFLAPNLDFWCIDDGHNATISTFANTSWNQCEVSKPTDSFNYNFTVTEPCTKWNYDLTDFTQTIVSEWDLVCDKAWLVSFSKSIYMFGFMVSVFLFGQISDCFGRFPTAIMCYVITCCSSLISAFSTSVLMFLILRFLAAFGRTGLTTTGYVLLLEIVGPELRTEMGIVIQFGWAVGFMLLPALAYFIRPWYWFQLAIAIPLIPLACVYWVVPESPRWLMTQGKKEQFVQVMMKAAKLNGKEVKPEVLEAFVTSKNKEQDVKRKTFFDLVRQPRIGRRTLYMALLWLVNAFVYYALSYNTNDLGGDMYLNFLFSAIMELLSYIAILLIVRKMGRKKPLFIGMILGGLACAAIMAVPQGMTWLIITLSMTGKFCITATFGLLYLYTSEMFPTVVRNIAIGSCSTCARIGSITAPFVRELEKATHYTVPFALNAGLAIVTSFLTFLLPETRNRKIPDTLEEGEKLGFDDKLETKQKENVRFNFVNLFCSCCSKDG